LKNRTWNEMKIEKHSNYEVIRVATLLYRSIIVNYNFFENYHVIIQKVILWGIRSSRCIFGNSLRNTVYRVIDYGHEDETFSSGLWGHLGALIDGLCSQPLPGSIYVYPFKVNSYLIQEITLKLQFECLGHIVPVPNFNQLLNCCNRQSHRSKNTDGLHFALLATRFTDFVGLLVDRI
jgi:hypothetical protein